MGLYDSVLTMIAWIQVAIAGAPVTDWLWYDTGYTERYLGIPPDALSAYEVSSVLSVCGRFPNE